MRKHAKYQGLHHVKVAGAARMAGRWQLDAQAMVCVVPSARMNAEIAGASRIGPLPGNLGDPWTWTRRGYCPAEDLTARGLASGVSAADLTGSSLRASFRMTEPISEADTGYPKKNPCT